MTAGYTMDHTVTVEKLPDDRDLLIPVSVVLRDGEPARISCYAEFEQVAAEYADRYGGDLLSREAVGFLFERIDPVMRSRGYSMPQDAPETDFVGLLFVAPEPGKHEVVNADLAAQAQNMTDIDLDEAAAFHQEAFVCLADGKVVSVAVENFAGDDYVEIACETAADYRRRGYAYSACAALIRDIVGAGYAVSWQTSESNTPSIMLAEKLGFKRCGREAYFCYYLN